MKSEGSWGGELVVRHQGENASLELAACKSWFSNYIDQIATGAVEDELPVYQYVQGRARYWGVEAQGSATLASFGDWALSADALADYVRATLSDVGPAPRIPPLRLRSEEHTSELQSLKRISYAGFCLKKKKRRKPRTRN